VDGSVSLARRLGVSSLVIGLTVVAFGTSLPELIVNIFAVGAGAGEVVFGNIIGSNIANILLVLGITALIAKVPVKNSTIWEEIPFALLAVFVLFCLFLVPKIYKYGDDLEYCMAYVRRKKLEMKSIIIILHLLREVIKFYRKI